MPEVVADQVAAGNQERLPDDPGHDRHRHQPADRDLPRSTAERVPEEQELRRVPLLLRCAHRHLDRMAPRTRAVIATSPHPRPRSGRNTGHPASRHRVRFERADTSVVAAICLYGYYGSIDADERFPSSPLAYLRADAPPFFVAHGDKDTLVLVEDARRFVQRLRRTSSNPVVYAELPGGQHTSTCSARSASRRSSAESTPSPSGSG
jgi:acetyl esterase/lipase